MSTIVEGKNMSKTEFNQIEYNQFYDRLARFALYKANGLLHDESQRQDAVDNAMWKFVSSAGFTQVGNRLIVNPEIADIEAWGKTVITNSIKNFARDKKLESINLEGEEYQGMHGYREV